MYLLTALTCISSQRRHAHIMRSCSAAAASERRLTVLYNQHVLNSGLEHGYGHTCWFACEHKYKNGQTYTTISNPLDPFDGISYLLEFKKVPWNQRLKNKSFNKQFQTCMTPLAIYFDSISIKIENEHSLRPM